MRELDVQLDGGGTVRAYDTGTLGEDELAVFWHHGTPNIGTPPRPLFATAQRLGMRWVSFDRPGYGGSTPQAGRSVASSAPIAARVADELDIERFAVVGHSGGGPHALACAALLPERVRGAVTGASLAPYGADGLDWFTGMAASGVASLTTAAQGRAAKEHHEAAAGDSYDPEFTAADMETLRGEWSWLEEVVGPAVAQGPAALIDDDLAYVSPWGFDPATIRTPTLLLHGDADRVVPAAHSRWLAARIPSAELRVSAGDGHLSVLRHMADGLEWLARASGV